MTLSSDLTLAFAPTSRPLMEDPAYKMLAYPLRFAAVCEVVEREHPERARWMRQWSPKAQEGTLKWLETVTTEVPAVSELELWTLSKGTRTLRCIARYLPNGIDLRLLEGDDFRRTELHKDGDLAELKATGWRQALEERGWK